MRFQTKKIVDDTAITVSKNYESVQLDHIYGFSVHFVWASTTADATIQIQASNNNVNWDAIASASQVIANNSGNVLFNIPDVFYKYFRCVVTVTSGTVTTLEATYQIKGF